jgi:hypothetical protein
MTNKQDDINNFANVNPKIWGPSAWQFIHSVSFTYSHNPSNEEKHNFKHFYESLQYTLPCAGCRESYSNFIITEPTILANALDNRETLTKWLYDVHNRVNQKLGVDYGITYDEVVQKYESYRVTNDKQKCFQNAMKKDCPLIKLSLANCFKEYAIKRGIEFNPGKYAEIMKNKECDEWTLRNIKCLEIIQKIRLSGQSAVEQEGEFKGLPTLNELTLISMLSTTLRKNELIELTKRLGCEIKYIYVLTKENC